MRYSFLAGASLAVMFTSRALGDVFLNPSFDVNNTEYRAQARYRISNTNWDTYIGTSPFVAPANIVQQKDIGNQNALNGAVWNFSFAYTAGSGYAWTLSNANTSHVLSWTGTHTDGSIATGAFNAIELYVVAGATMPNGVTSAYSKIYDVAFGFVGSGPSVSGSLRNLQDTWNAGVNTGLDQQFIYSDTDLSGTSFVLSGKVQLGFTNFTSGNFDERLKFNIKTAIATPAPASLSLLGVFGIAATRRRR